MIGISWVTPGACHPPHKVTHPEHVEELKASLEAEGWRETPRLVGYRWEDGKIQLLNGSHRWAAASELKLAMPVRIVPFRLVVRAWGDLNKWKELIDGSDSGQEPSQF